jgi:hypothetical protein
LPERGWARVVSSMQSRFSSPHLRSVQTATAAIAVLGTNASICVATVLVFAFPSRAFLLSTSTTLSIESRYGLIELESFTDLILTLLRSIATESSSPRHFRP